MLHAMIYLLNDALIIGVLCWAANRLIAVVPMPAELRQLSSTIILVIGAIIILILALRFLLPVVGSI